MRQLAIFGTTALLLLLLLVGCSDPATGDGRDAPGEAGVAPIEAAAPAAPTFTTDVAPLLFAHCVTCHRPGQSAPFSLLTYRDAAKRSRQIAAVTGRRYMPPWLPSDAGGHAFVGDRRLDEAAIATFAAWHRSGAPEGPADAMPEPPAFHDGWHLDEPDLVLEAADEITLAAEGDDAFVNLVLPVRIDRPRWVRAVQIRPGNPRVVHHAILQLDTRGGCRDLDAADDQPGFQGMQMGTSEPPDGHFIGWTPGKVTREPPAAIAWRLPPGGDLVLQLHMIRSGKTERVRPRIGLWFQERPATRQAYAIVLENENIAIPAGAAAHDVVDEYVVPTDVDVLALYPHAHYLGARMTGTATAPTAGRADTGESRTLLAIDAWDFNWQDEYWFQEPVRLTAGTTLRMTWTFDNSADNPRNPNDPPLPVRFGPRSVDEMATWTLMVVPVDAARRPLLELTRWQRALVKKPYDWHAANQLGAVLARLGDTERALTAFAAALELRPDYADAHANIGFTLLTSGDAAQAIPHFERALRAESTHANALVQLGEALAAVGRTDDALAHLRRAVTRQPDHAELHLQLGNLLATAVRDFDSALVSYREALRLQPHLPEAHNNLANTLVQRDDAGAAVPHYERAVELRPDYFNARFNLGRTLVGLGRTADALPHLRIAADLRPDDAFVRQTLDAARAGQASRR